MGLVLSLLFYAPAVVLVVLYLRHAYAHLHMRVLDEKVGLVPVQHLRQRVTRQQNGSTLVQAYLSHLSGELKDQFGDYEKAKEEGRAAVEVGERGCRPIVLAKTGAAAARAVTVMELFQRAVDRLPNSVCLVAAKPDTRTWTWRQYYDDAIVVARALVSFGFQAGDTVNIMGFNSPEYFIMEMGTIAAGGKAAGIYTTNSPESCRYISEHSRAFVVAVQNDVQLKKFLEIRADLPRLRAIVCWSPFKQEEIVIEESFKEHPTGADCDVLTWEQFMARGRATESSAEDEVNRRIDVTQPGEAVALIYTSGTTGNPKAVMISNDNVTWTARITWSEAYGGLGRIPESENVRIVSYLPLSHIAAQMIDIFVPIFGPAFIGLNATIYFADDKALKGTLLDTLIVARPTQFFGVPRVWEKFMEAIQSKGSTTEGFRKDIIRWARNQGTAYIASIQNDGKRKRLSAPLLFPIAKVILDRIRSNMGLDECRFFFSGAAPISGDILKFFASLNIPLLELYGMSESTGPQTVCYDLPTKIKSMGFQLGSCGPCMPGAEMLLLHDPKRDPAGQGEVCYRGRHVMLGYMNDLEKSKEAIDEDGWLHSGDVGRVDENGMLYITGRIKELLITKGGENIAPVPVEEAIKSLLPAISNIVMVGDKRHFCTALVTLRSVPNPDGTFSDELDPRSLVVAPECKTSREAMTNETWISYIQAGIDKYNSEVAVSAAQKIQKFTIIPGDFSIPGGELGPTLKLKRGEVMKKYGDIIEGMYSSSTTI